MRFCLKIKDFPVNGEQDFFSLNTRMSGVNYVCKEEYEWCHLQQYNLWHWHWTCGIIFPPQFKSLAYSKPKLCNGGLKLFFSNCRENSGITDTTLTRGIRYRKWKIPSQYIWHCACTNIFHQKFNNPTYPNLNIEIVEQNFLTSVKGGVITHNIFIEKGLERTTPLPINLWLWTCVKYFALPVP